MIVNWKNHNEGQWRNSGVLGQIIQTGPLSFPSLILPLTFLLSGFNIKFYSTLNIKFNTVDIVLYKTSAKAKYVSMVKLQEYECNLTVQ